MRLTSAELRESVETRGGRCLVGLLVFLAYAAAGYPVVSRVEDGPVIAVRFSTVP